MANHLSAKTRIRRNARRAAINGARRSRIRTIVKKVELAIAAGDVTQAEAAFVTARPEMQRGAAKGLAHARNVSRKISRLSARIKALKTG
jgi:small subunit ribosomal protein S20